jgi:hypothetical protein
MFTYFVALALAAPAPKEEIAKCGSLQTACEAYAKTVIDKLGDKSTVAVGLVTTPPRFGLATGAGVEMALVSALERVRKGVVAQDAKYEIRGDVAYRDVAGVTKNADGSDGTQKVPVVTLKTIDKQTGAEVPGVGSTVALTSPTELARLFGVTVRLEPNASPVEVHQQMVKAIEHPTAFINKARVQTVKDSPYSVEVLLRKDGQQEPQMVEHEGAKTFVKVAKGDSFIVRLNNPSEDHLGARLFYDGMDTYNFAERNAEGRPFATVFHVPPKKAQKIMGWVFTPTTWEEFRIGGADTLNVPPARDSKWGSLTVAVMPMRPNPKQPGRLSVYEPIEFITVRLAR